MSAPSFSNCAVYRNRQEEPFWKVQTKERDKRCRLTLKKREHGYWVTLFSVNIQRTLSALQWLRSHNHRYAQVRIREDVKQQSGSWMRAEHLESEADEEDFQESALMDVNV